MRHKMHTLVVVRVIGNLLLLIGIVFHVVGMSTHHFSELSDYDARKAIETLDTENMSSLAAINVSLGIHYGFWKICVNAPETDEFHGCYQMGSKNDIKYPDWLTPVQALAIVGLAVAIAGLLAGVGEGLMRKDRVQFAVLIAAALFSFIGGIFILSGDITFAAKNTIAFYAYQGYNRSVYFGYGEMKETQRAYEIQIYDNAFTTGYSFALDLAAGAICILASPAFVYLAMFQHWEEQNGYYSDEKQQKMPGSQFPPMAIRKTHAADAKF